MEIRRIITVARSFPTGGGGGWVRKRAKVPIVIEIDEQRLAEQLGAPAAYNKSRQSRALRGAIVAKAPKEIAWEIDR
jgi:hypothetical protein